jgi:DnaJ-class molecular chaperone
MSEAEREARHPAPLKRCRYCNGTGTVGKADEHVAGQPARHWDIQCPVCKGRGYEPERSDASAAVH